MDLRNITTLLSTLSLLFTVSCDKALHLGAGFAISETVTEVTNAPELGCVSAVVAGAIKEMVDFIPDPIDFVATVIGGCISLTI